MGAESRRVTCASRFLAKASRRAVNSERRVSAVLAHVHRDDVDLGSGASVYNPDDFHTFWQDVESCLSEPLFDVDHHRRAFRNGSLKQLGGAGQIFFRFNACDLFFDDLSSIPYEKQLAYFYVASKGRVQTKRGRV